MCVICVKRKGVRMPTVEEMKAMWDRNHDGAGFMYARKGRLYIQKGFMSLDELMQALDAAAITEKDPLVLHFRISTQGGINPQMCHPFPVSDKYEDMEALTPQADVAVAHNGVIQRTTAAGSRFSDTALFVARYVSAIIRKPDDIKVKALMEAIEALASIPNKFAFMNNRGAIAIVGHLSTVDGLMYSNLYHDSDYISKCKSWGFWR